MENYKQASAMKLYLRQIQHIIGRHNRIVICDVFQRLDGHEHEFSSEIRQRFRASFNEGEPSDINLPNLIQAGVSQFNCYSNTNL